MLKRILLSATALTASPLSAQAWQDPNWLDGSVPVPVWTDTPVVGNGVADADATITQGGTPPAIQFEPAVLDEQGYVRADWLTTEGVSRSDQGEAKFRIVCEDVGRARVDPILFEGSDPAGHDHTFIGDLNTFSSDELDYTTTRTNPSSSCPGGPLNTVRYWHPTLHKNLPSGVRASHKADSNNFYYTHLYTQSPKKTRLFRDLAFIGGMNPGDFNFTYEKGLIDTYNAANVGEELEYPDQDRFGWRGWFCTAPGAVVTKAHARRTQFQLETDSNGPFVYASYLQGPNGEDPWNGTCTSGYELTPELFAPDCWDGRNLRSPDGRRHVSYSTKRKDNSVTDICPTGWWHIPSFEGKSVFSHNGPSDYMEWYFSSDRMNPSGTAADPTSDDPCRQVGPYFCNAATPHFDWANVGQDQTMFNIAMAKCMGISLPEYLNGDTSLEPEDATCDSGTISATQRLKGGVGGEAPPEAGHSRNPIVTTYSRYNDAAVDRYFPLTQEDIVGPVVIEHDH